MPDGDERPVETVPTRPGDILRYEREAQGLTIADIAARTRIPQRHLESIDASDYSGLPSTTYATGFARAYAKALGDQSTLPLSTGRPRLVILGTGWGGARLARDIDPKKFDITVIDVETGDLGAGVIQGPPALRE